MASRRAVFGRDIARAFNVARRIDSGICHVNAPTVHDEAQMPFGGVKGSGMGRFGGKAGIAEFTDPALDHGPDLAASLPVLKRCHRGLGAVTDSSLASQYKAC